MLLLVDGPTMNPNPTPGMSNGTERLTGTASRPRPLRRWRNTLGRTMLEHPGDRDAAELFLVVGFTPDDIKRLRPGGLRLHVFTPDTSRMA